MDSKLSLWILLLLAVPTAHAQTLRVTVSTYLSAPYGIYDKGELQRGLIKDMFDILATELSVMVKYVNIPRKRLEQGLESGEIHVAAVANPQWYTTPSRFGWTDPWHRLKEGVVMRKDSKLQYQSPLDLKGMRLGTILGYLYPLFEPYFRSGSIVRSDVQTADQNVDMLLSRRIDAFVVHDIVFKYLQNNSTQGIQLTFTDTVSSPIDVSCAVSKKSPVSVEQLNNFMSNLKKSGRLEQLLKKYASPATDENQGKAPK